MTDTTQGTPMTNTPVAPQQESAATTDGRGPTGMWWVAWRQHRTLVLVELGLMAVAALALITFRLVFAARIEAWGGSEVFLRCTTGTGPDAYPAERCLAVFRGRDALGEWWTVIRALLIALPGVVGVPAGATTFAGERERRTHVFALTQSVGRARWYWTSGVVLIVPLTAGMIVVGLLTEWSSAIWGPRAWWIIDAPTFQTFGLVPAVLTLMAVGISLAVGTFLRSTLAAVVLALGLTVVAVGGVGYLGYPDLVTPRRIATDPRVDAYQLDVPMGALRGEEGYLDAAGDTVEVRSCPEPDILDTVDPETANTIISDAFFDCLASQGVTARYSDYVDPVQRTPLTINLAGLSLLIAGASLAGGFVRIRRRSL